MHPTQVLVIEDNNDDELLLLRMLRQSRLESHVHVVRDGRKALDYWTRHEAKIEDLIVVFLDLNIPSIHGLQLLAMMRNNQSIVPFTRGCHDVLERAYIANQAEHHRKKSFQEEYRSFLGRHGIAFDERYVWD